MHTTGHQNPPVRKERGGVHDARVGHAAGRGGRPSYRSQKLGGQKEVLLFAARRTETTVTSTRPSDTSVAVCHFLDW